MSYEIPENLFDGVKVKAHKENILNLALASVRFSGGLMEARRLCTMSTT